MTAGPADSEGPLPSTRWLAGFRGAFYLGALLSVVGAQPLFGVDVAGALPAVVATIGGLTSILGLRSRGGVLVALLAFDAVALTVVLSHTGGAANPFALVYFVQVTLAAVTVPPAGVAAVVATASVGYGSLFWSGEAHAHGAYADHLRGMWLAFTLTATAIGAFVSRLTQAFLRERESRAQTARLLGLTTLAAGAAHELGNPLGTIKLVAFDLARELRGAGQTEWADDAQVIVEEVCRAREVLDRMGVGAGELGGEGPRLVSPQAVLDELFAHLGGDGDRVDVRSGSAELALRVPVHATAQALTQLVRNALDAAPEGRVDLSVEPGPEGVRFHVRDTGPGMVREVLERAGEPFFTTKAPGRGMGLGLFLARALAEQLGGRLELRSRPGEGTEAVLDLPRTGRDAGGPGV